jgi:hypothetical protein
MLSEEELKSQLRELEVERYESDFAHCREIVASACSKKSNT